jgi:hypothetical protein
MFLRSQILTNSCIKKIMHPYEWGIIGIRRLIFTGYSTVPIAHIAPAVVENLVAAQASIAPTVPIALG